MCEQGPIANTDQSQTNFLLILHTFLPNSRCKRRAISNRLKRQKKKGEKLPVDLVKLAKIAISAVHGKA
jgi:N-glycosylase/DNA lyase